MDFTLASFSYDAASFSGLSLVGDTRDGLVNGTTFTDEQGRFHYLPQALPLGAHTIRARALEWSDHLKDWQRGPWQSVSFVLEAQTPAALQVVALELADQTPV